MRAAGPAGQAGGAWRAALVGGATVLAVPVAAAPRALGAISAAQVTRARADGGAESGEIRCQ